MRLGKQRTSYGEFGNDIVGGNVYSGSSAAGVGAAGGSSQGVVGNSHRNNFNSRGDGGSSSRGTSIGSSSLSGGGSTSIFNSGASGGGGTTSTFSNFGSNGNSASFSAGGMSVKGDSSIFSSVGFIGQQGTVTNVFSEKGGGRSTSGGSGATSRNMGVSAGGVAERPSGLRGGVGESPLRSPVPPSEEPRLDWLRQEPPQNEHDWMDSPAATDYDATRSYYTNVLNDNALPTSYKSNWISQQYQEQGLDYLSGGLEGFGAIKGVETSGGESRNRARADNIPQPGVAGNTGVTMGGDFSSFGAVGDGQRRSSARYNSGGGDDGFDDNDFVD